MPRVTIKAVLPTEILHAPNFPDLRAEYAAEAATAGLPDTGEKEEAYLALQASGVFQAYAAYCHDTLVGFVTVVAPVLPHFGVAVAVTESLFVAAAYRKTGAGMLLLRQAEAHARAIGSPGLLVSAPTRGRLALLLPRLGYRETNRAFLKEL